MKYKPNHSQLKIHKNKCNKRYTSKYNNIEDMYHMLAKYHQHSYEKVVLSSNLPAFSFGWFPTIPTGRPFMRANPTTMFLAYVGIIS